MTLADLRAALGNANVAAFLRVIRDGESSQDDSAYTVMFGGRHFDTANGWRHPNIVNRAGGYASTAAGAYQFLYRTWSGLVQQYRFPDFAPHCQDMGAVALIAGRGALQDVMAGRFEAAIAKCNREWASLPGSPYGQPTRTLVRAKAVYEQYGGRYGAQPVAKVTPVYSDNKPAQPAEDRMDPLSLVSLLAGVFAPVIRAKTQKALGTEVGGQLADSLMAVTQQVTGKADPLEAVAVARQNPEMVAKIEAAADDWLAKVAPLIDKIQAYEVAAWQASEESMDRAAKRGADMSDDLLHSPQFLIALFILAMVAGVVFTVLFKDTFSSDMQSFVIGAIVGSALTAVISFFFGTSRSSAAKDTVISELAARR